MQTLIQAVAGPADSRGYMVQPSDLTPAMGTCARCGGPRPGLELRLDFDRQGHAQRGAPKLDEIPGLRTYLERGECSHCSLTRAAHDLTMPAYHGAIVQSPVDAELAALRAQLNPAPPPPAEKPVKGALFKIGRVVVTPAALAAVAMVHVPTFDASVGGMANLGREFVPDLVARHARGDFGTIGQLAAGNVARGVRLGVMAARLDANAASIDGSIGTVLSIYRLDVKRVEMGADGEWRPERIVDRLDVVVRTECGHAPLTLICLPGELPAV